MNKIQNSPTILATLAKMPGRARRDFLAMCVRGVANKRRKALAARGIYGLCDVERNARLKAWIDKAAEGGRVLLLNSGMDCDCAQWRNVILGEYVANVTTIKAAINQRLEWAEGHETFDLAPPSDRDKIEPETRDLVLEAFERGNQYAVQRAW